MFESAHNSLLSLRFRVQGLDYEMRLCLSDSLNVLARPQAQCPTFSHRRSSLQCQIPLNDIMRHTSISKNTIPLNCRLQYIEEDICRMPAETFHALTDVRIHTRIDTYLCYIYITRLCGQTGFAALILSFLTPGRE